MALSLDALPGELDGTRRAAPAAAPSSQELTTRFLRTQGVNALRHSAAVRPFRRDEFGDAPASPSPAHIQAANQLITKLRKRLMANAKTVASAAKAAEARPDTARLKGVLAAQQAAERSVKTGERVWDFYFELFGQRQSSFQDWLLVSDRIANDCYEAVYTNLASHRSVPSPGPFSHIETTYTPATFRRGVQLSRLGRRANPFPIISLPYHRLVNPWTLGAIHHEVSHNLQNDLGLWQEVPRRITSRLQRQQLPAITVRAFTRWHKEIWADLVGLLLGGPGVVGSLVDVLARPTRRSMSFRSSAVHPVPYLRLLINTELLKRMGFASHATSYERMWKRLYPSGGRRRIPRALLASFPKANAAVVDEIAYRPYRQLGGQALTDVVSFTPANLHMTAEAGKRVAAGLDPGIVPPRFLVGAVREALDERLAPPGQLAKNYYAALVKR